MKKSILVSSFVFFIGIVAVQAQTTKQVTPQPQVQPMEQTVNLKPIIPAAKSPTVRSKTNEKKAENLQQKNRAIKEKLALQQRKKEQQKTEAVKQELK